ncbi:DedA family protein [Patescibacteria group bacterium]|nr:DedA family protein [Patescibacteria group bacterium]MDE1946491.1 DedA family protein [Patescibacteria group bacterium]MDE2011264.1 DedA family protein [Patescibacteria group bacterium]MDE2233347.1 DedA family protein [Patescibacteria group bacterium]
MQEWLIQLVTVHPYVVYGVIILLAIVEGPVISMIGGVLVRLGYFDFIPMYAVLMVSDAVADMGWYWIGLRYGHAFIKRFGKYFSITEQGVEKVTKIFHRYKHHILIFSKITNGFGLALVTLMTAGMVRIPFWKYVGLNMIGQFVWTGVLMAIGYYLGHLYVQINTWFGRIGIVMLFVLILIGLARYRSYLRKRVETSES